MAGTKLPLRRDGVRCRPLCVLDAEDVALACNDSQIQRWLPLPCPYGLADARDFIASAGCDCGQRDAQLTFAIERDDPEPGRLLGCISLDPIAPAHRVFQIGYWIAPWARRQRVAVRATRLLAEWAIRSHGVERVELRISPGNDASAGVARGCGFTFEGTMRQVAYHRDQRIDLDLYSLLPRELT